MANPTYRGRSLTRTAERAWQERDAADPVSTALWDDVAALVRRMRSGHAAWELPAYNGDLFAADRVAGSATLEVATISDAALGPALVALARDGEDPEVGVDFSGLEIGHLGYVYAVGQLVDDLDEEVCAAAGRIQHVEVEALAARGGWVGRRECADLVQVADERGPDRAVDEVTNQLGARVVDAATLAPALVGEPEEPTLADVRLGVPGRRDVTVGARVVGERAVGQREAQRQQPLDRGVPAGGGQDAARKAALGSQEGQDRRHGPP